MRVSSVDGARGLGLRGLLVAALAASACSGDGTQSTADHVTRTGALAGGGKRPAQGRRHGQDHRVGRLEAASEPGGRPRHARLERARHGGPPAPAGHRQRPSGRPPRLARRQQRRAQAVLDREHDPGDGESGHPCPDRQAAGRRRDPRRQGDPVPPLVPAAPVLPILGTEWGLDSVRAPEAWQTFGAFGEGIVVANIDTGVQFDHPALVDQYRGNTATARSTTTTTGATRPTSAHRRWRRATTTTTAPTRWARWSATTAASEPDRRRAGREVDRRQGLRDQQLLRQRRCSRPASGCWRRPTSTGQNPRPELRPDIVNNSWGGGGGNTLYQPDRRRLGGRRHLPGVLRSATRPGLRQRRLAW